MVPTVSNFLCDEGVGIGIEVFRIRLDLVFQNYVKGVKDYR